MPKSKKKEKKRKLTRISLPEIIDPNSEKFTRLSFLVRRSDILSTGLQCIWSIENHVLIVKWVQTEVNGQFQITNRYNLWNASETYRYIHVELLESEISDARETGIITLDSHCINGIFE